MRPRPDAWLHVAVVGGAGAIWGLGLARLMAEAGFWTLLFVSPLTVASVAIICAAIALAVWLLPHSNAPIPQHSHTSAILLALPLLYVTGVVSHPLAGCVLLVGGVTLALLLVWGDRVRWLPPAVLGLATFALYLRTLLPSVGVADTFEFQVVVPLLRVAHPTGYPLYILLGKLFTLLPLGNVAWRVSLASAVFATAAVLVLYALLLRLTALRQAQDTARWLPAFLAALAFAFSSTFWSQAIIAEVYALHNLLVGAILWLLLPPFIPPIGGDRGGAARRWQAIFFLIGLSLTNHLTTALLLPAVVLALLWDRPRLRLKDWLVAGGLLLLGLSVYSFIPLRWPALNQGAWMTPRDFIAYVSGGQFHGALRLGGWRDPVRWGIVGRLLHEPFGWIGLGLAAAGVVQLAVRQRRALALTGATCLAFVLYGLDYYVPDISVFLLPAHLILAVWIGVGIASLIDLLSILAKVRWQSPGQERLRPSGIAPWPGPFATFARMVQCLSLFIGSLFIVHCLSRIWLNLPLVDQSHNQGGYAWGQYVLSLPLVSDSVVLADVEKFAPLYYLQQIEGVRPDLDLLLLGSEELYQAELAARLGMGQTVYLARYLPHLEGLHLRSLGPLVEVRVEPFGHPSPDFGRGDGGAGGHPSPDFGRGDGGEGGDEAGVSFGEEISLLDVKVSADPLGRALYHLTLYWRAETHVSGDFAVRLRLVDAEGEVRWESDGTRPVGGLYPTNAWPVGAVVSDYHEVSLPPWLPPGEYGLEVGLFPPFGGVGLEVDGGATAWLALKTLEVALPSGSLPPLPRERRYCFAGGAWLTGYNLAGEASAGASFAADLSWHGVEVGEEVRLAWVDARGREIGAVFAADSLAAGLLRSHHVITAPQSAGDYTLRVGLVGETAHCGWLAPPTDDCPLATVEVVPAQEGLANFAAQVLLLDAEVGSTNTRPGETVPVALQWRALRAMDKDYTVFVHLVGPDGRLHGQVDMWPVQGSYPTTRWTPGEELTDLYEVRLAPDAPPGHYQVEVGWYLLATMRRLQVVDADGQPIGDALVVGEFDASD